MKLNSVRERRGMLGKAQHGQQGSALVFVVLLLPIIIGFAAMAIDVGYWYVVKAELSKSVDPAALVGAKNVGNSNVSTLVNTVGQANFPAGRLGTPAAPTYTGVQDINNHTYTVTGTVTANRYFSYWMAPPTFSKSATAKMRKVEVVLVLDRSWSMSGTPMTNLKTAAKAFVNVFVNTQAVDKLGLISFSTTATVNVSLGDYKVTAITNAINNMNANGSTNAEDALAKASTQPFTNQTGMADTDRATQFVIFFSDGQPNVFTDTFLYNGTTYTAVATQTPDLLNAVNGNTMSIPPPTPTGDGKTVPATNPLSGTCNATYTSCCSYNSSRNRSTYTLNTRWDSFSYRYAYPADAAAWAVSNPPVDPSPPPCRSGNQLNFIPDFVDAASYSIAIDNATTIKKHLYDNTIKIYAIGINVTAGTTFESFLKNVASDPDSQYYYPTTSANLTGIFNRIARDIQMMLVQ